MEADPRTLKTVFGSDVRLTVPLFQRPYVWTASEQWQPLWEDVLAVADRSEHGDVMPHFRGAIVLEQLALRRLTSTAFGTLMALEPAIAVLLGLLVLGQRLALAQLAGIVLVVTAGGTAQRKGQRTTTPAGAANRTAANVNG